jgi:hypothetical protein
VPSDAGALVVAALPARRHASACSWHRCWAQLSLWGAGEPGDAINSTVVVARHRLIRGRLAIQRLSAIGRVFKPAFVDDGRVWRSASLFVAAEAVALACAKRLSRLSPNVQARLLHPRHRKPGAHACRQSPARVTRSLSTDWSLRGANDKQ